MTAVTAEAMAYMYLPSLGTGHCISCSVGSVENNSYSLKLPCPDRGLQLQGAHLCLGDKEYTSSVKFGMCCNKSIQVT